MCKYKVFVSNRRSVKVHRLHTYCIVPTYLCVSVCKLACNPILNRILKFIVHQYDSTSFLVFFLF